MSEGKSVRIGSKPQINIHVVSASRGSSHKAGPDGMLQGKKNDLSKEGIFSY